MKCKPVQPEEALQQGKRLPYLLYYTYSQAYLGPVPQELPDMSQVLRLSFFGPQEEIRLFRQDGETLCGVSMEEEEGVCPVPGNLCDCQPPIWREHYRCKLSNIRRGWAGAAFMPPV